MLVPRSTRTAIPNSWIVRCCAKEKNSNLYFLNRSLRPVVLPGQTSSKHIGLLNLSTRANVTEAPGVTDEAATHRYLNLRLGPGWAKSQSFATGQTPVMKYNRELMMAMKRSTPPPPQRPGAVEIAVTNEGSCLCG